MEDRLHHALIWQGGLHRNDDAANQIVQFGGGHHDPNGNLTNDGARSYTWNARNELTGECLGSDADPVWKAALDGLVTLGGPNVRTALQDVIVGESQRKQEWIREAIIQVEAETTVGGACDSKQ